MFLTNKYTKWYNLIIKNAVTRILDTNTYCERHHIIPKSIGGNNDKTNLVKLTAREHFICHLLLTRMIEGKFRAKMINAAWALINLKTSDQHRVKITGRTYELVRKKFALQHSEYRLGQHHSESTKAKISESNKGKSSSLKGVPRLQETKDKISKTLTGKSKSDEHKKNIKLTHKGFTGKIPTPEHKMKISQKRLLTPKLLCPHCNRSIDPANYKKYHGDKCKLFVR